METMTGGALIRGLLRGAGVLLAVILLFAVALVAVLALTTAF